MGVSDGTLSIEAGQKDADNGPYVTLTSAYVI